MCTYTSSTRSQFDDFWIEFCFPAGLVHGKNVENWKKISHTEWLCVHSTHSTLCTHTSCTRSRFDDYWIEFCFSARLVHGKRVENLKTNFTYRICVHSTDSTLCSVYTHQLYTHPIGRILDRILLSTHTSCTRSRLDDFWIEFCFPAGLMNGNKSKI